MQQPAARLSFSVLQNSGQDGVQINKSRNRIEHEEETMSEHIAFNIVALATD